MGWEEATPLENDLVSSQDKAQNFTRSLNGRQGSFLTLNDNKLLLDTWKPAEDGHGTILRFLDYGDTTRPVTVKIPILNLQQVWQTNAVETNQKSLPLLDEHSFQFTLHPHEIVTIRVIGKDNTPDISTMP